MKNSTIVCGNTEILYVKGEYSAQILLSRCETKFSGWNANTPFDTSLAARHTKKIIKNLKIWKKIETKVQNWGSNTLTARAQFQ